MKARSGFDLCRDLIPEDLVFLLVSWLGGNYFFFFFLNHQTIRVKRQALSCKKPQIAPKIPWGNSLNPDWPPRQSFPRAEGLRLLQARLPRAVPRGAVLQDIPVPSPAGSSGYVGGSEVEPAKMKGVSSKGRICFQVLIHWRQSGDL